VRLDGLAWERPAKRESEHQAPQIEGGVAPNRASSSSSVHSAIPQLTSSVCPGGAIIAYAPA